MVGMVEKEEVEEEEVKSNSSSHKSRSRIFHYLEHSFRRFSHSVYSTCMPCAAYVGGLCVRACVCVYGYVGIHKRSQDKVLYYTANNQGGNVEYIYK